MRPILILIMLFSFSPNNNLFGQEISDISEAKTAILKLIKAHNDSLLETKNEKIEMLFEFFVDKKNENDSNNLAYDNVKNFYFMKGNTFRFYIYAISGSVKLSLLQMKGGVMKRKSEKISIFPKSLWIC